MAKWNPQPQPKPQPKVVVSWDQFDEEAARAGAAIQTANQNRIRTPRKRKKV